MSIVLDPAVGAGSSLLVASTTELEPLALSVIMGYDAIEVNTPDVSGPVRRRPGSPLGSLPRLELRSE